MEQLEREEDAPPSSLVAVASPVKGTRPLALFLGFLMDNKDHDSVIEVLVCLGEFIVHLWWIYGHLWRRMVVRALMYMNSCFCDFLAHM